MVPVLSTAFPPHDWQGNGLGQLLSPPCPNHHFLHSFTEKEGSLILDNVLFFFLVALVLFNKMSKSVPFTFCFLSL